MIRNEKLLKGCFKRKVSVTMSLLVGFMIMGHVVMGSTYKNTLNTNSSKYKGIESVDSEETPDEGTKETVGRVGGSIGGETLSTKTFEFKDGDKIVTKDKAAITANGNQKKIIVKNVDIESIGSDAVNITRAFVELQGVNIARNEGRALRITNGLLLLNDVKIEANQTSIGIYGNSLITDGEGSAQIIGDIKGKESEWNKSKITLKNSESFIKGNIENLRELTLDNGAYWKIPDIIMEPNWAPRENILTALYLGEASRIYMGINTRLTIGETFMYNIEGEYSGQGEIVINEEVSGGILNRRNMERVFITKLDEESVVNLIFDNNHSLVNTLDSKIALLNIAILRDKIDVYSYKNNEDIQECNLGKEDYENKSENMSEVNVKITEGTITPWVKGRVDLEYKKESIDEYRYTTEELLGILNGESEDVDLDEFLEDLESRFLTWEVGPRQTAFMTSLANLGALGVAGWRDQTTLRQRLGNIRDKEEGNGVWARIKGGQVNYNDVTSEYEFVQVGWDKKAGQYNIGGAVSHSRGDIDFNNRGDGEIEDFTLSLYATKFYDSGWYMDYVAKLGKIDTDYTLPVGTTMLGGDYSNAALYLGVEGGKEMMMNEKFAIKPYGKLTLAYAKGDDYTTDDGSIDISQEDVTNINARIGIEAIKKLQKGGELYAKVEVAKDFAGTVEADLNNGTTFTSYKEDMEETWTEVGIGFDKKIEENLTLYGEVNKSFGGDYEKDWEAQIGFKYKF